MPHRTGESARPDALANARSQLSIHSCTTPRALGVTRLLTVVSDKIFDLGARHCQLARPRQTGDRVGIAIHELYSLLIFSVGPIGTQALPRLPAQAVHLQRHMFPAPGG